MYGRSFQPFISVRPLDDRDLDDREEGGAIVGGGNNTVTLFRNVCDHLKNDDFTNPKFQEYRRRVVTRVHKCLPVDPIADRVLHNELQDMILRSTMRKLYGIVSLDLSLPVHVPARSNYHERGYSVPWYLPRMLINPQDIDLSNVYCCFDVSGIFLQNCHQLEKVTWNNKDSDSCIFLDGYKFTISSSNLREPPRRRKIVMLL